MSTPPSPDSTPGSDGRTTGHALGVDVGGTGVKAALVDLATGEFVGDRVRVETPEPATPEAIADAVAGLLAELADAHPEAEGAPVGVTVPGVVRGGVVRSAANIDHAWIGTDAVSLLAERLDRRVAVLNDADAAGLAEARFGAARDQRGLVVLTTLGTGIGSALVHDGVLVPNSELGHLEIDGEEAEARASNRAREEEDLSFEHWARRLTRFYGTVEALLAPDLFVVGGGISKKSEEFLPLVEVETPLVVARLLNRAGIVGAALVAATT